MLTWVVFGWPPPGSCDLAYGHLCGAQADSDPYRTGISLPPRLRDGKQQSVHPLVRAAWASERRVRVIVFDAAVPGRKTTAVTVVLSVLLSIVADGATANPTDQRRSGASQRRALMAHLAQFCASR
jgi:hypothetical protein